jgi:hypothetical protein
LILIAEFMALMFGTPLMPVTLLIRLVDLVGFAKPLISSHSLHRKTHRNAPETRATQGFQPKKFFLFFFAVFAVFFSVKQHNRKTPASYQLRGSGTPFYLA